MDNRNKRHRDKCTKTGKCFNCGQSTKGSRSKNLCINCNIKDNKRATNRYHNKKQSGTCISCSKKAVEGKTQCQKCLDKRKNLVKQHRATRAIKSSTLGICIRCDSKPLDGRKMCEQCTYKHLSLMHLGSKKHWMDLKAIYDAQKGLCAYFGVPIVLGGNAQIDHKIPKARGGTNELSNLQWVHKWANFCKLDLTETEFTESLDKMLPFIIGKRKKLANLMVCQLPNN